MDAPHFASDLVEKDGALISTRPSAARASSSMRLSSRPRSVYPHTTSRPSLLSRDAAAQVIRYVILALDVSAHLEKSDLRPTRISFLRRAYPALHTSHSCSLIFKFKTQVRVAALY